MMGIIDYSQKYNPDWEETEMYKVGHFFKGADSVGNYALVIDEVSDVTCTIDIYAIGMCQTGADPQHHDLVRFLYCGHDTEQEYRMIIYGKSYVIEQYEREHQLYHDSGIIDVVCALHKDALALGLELSGIVKY